MTTSGSAYFFSVKRQNGIGQVIGHEVVDQRVFTWDRNKKLLGSEKSGPIFLECRNYLEFPKKYKGVVCAFKSNKHPSEWKLGVINNCIESQVLQIYVWNGRCS